MAELTAQQRLDGCGEYMREETATFAGLTKTDIRAAFNALDTFLNSNAAAINSTIPQPARGALTTEQKARLLVAVIRRRYIHGA